jgi:hypothetical protein
MATSKQIEERLEALERENRELRSTVAKLAPQPVVPRAIGPRTLPGQGDVLISSNGDRLVGSADPRATTVGGGGFGSVYREGPNGVRQYAPDGVPRSQTTGEVLAPAASAEPVQSGPTRNVQHQLAVAHLDRMFPIHRPHRPDDDAA